MISAHTSLVRLCRLGCSEKQQVYDCTGGIQEETDTQHTQVLFPNLVCIDELQHPDFRREDLVGIGIPQDEAEIILTGPVNTEIHSSE